MKKLLILLMAFSLFTACNNEKSARNDRDSRSNNSRDKDDYRNDDDRDKDKNSDEDEDSRDKDRNKDRDNDDRTTDDRDDNKSSGGWTSREVNEFVTTCVDAAEKGMSTTQARNYCECMQVKLERLYPNSNDAARFDPESNSAKRMIQECLE